LAALNDIAVSGWLAVVPFPYSREDFERFLTEYALPGETFAVDDATGFVGIVGMNDRTLGYWFAPQRQGLGYATEAARVALAEHFAQDASDIESGYFVGNSRSANVLRKLGFVEIGRDLKHCRALAMDRPHVNMTLGRDAFVATLPGRPRTA
jgi:RimJ/RimL family protein N-acetyltransferase